MLSTMQFSVVLAVLALETLAVVVLSVMQARLMRQARVGALLIDACGGYVAAIRELDRIHAETDVVAGRGMKAAMRRPIDVTNLSSSGPQVEQPRPSSPPGIVRHSEPVCECGHGGGVHYHTGACRAAGCQCSRYRPA